MLPNTTYISPNSTSSDSPVANKGHVSSDKAGGEIVVYFLLFMFVVLACIIKGTALKLRRDLSDYQRLANDDEEDEEEGGDDDEGKVGEREEQVEQVEMVRMGFNSTASSGALREEAVE
jgi:hypothetical protein